MCVCVCVCVCAYVYIYVCACVRVYIYVCVRLCAYVFSFKIKSSLNIYGDIMFVHIYDINIQFTYEMSSFFFL